MRRFLIFVLTFFIIGKSFCQNKEKTSISGQVFGDYFYNIERDDSISKINNAILNDPKNFNGFIFRRLNLTFNHTFTEKLSTRVNVEADQKALTSDGKIGFFIKDLFLKIDSFLIPYNTLKLGIIPTPVRDISERWWNHRFLEKTITDLRGIVSTRDFGIEVNTNFFNKKMFFNLMLGNGSYLKIEKNRFKNIYSLLGFNPLKNFITYFTFSYFFNDKKFNQYEETYINNDNYLITLFIGYNKKDTFSVGIELFTQTLNNEYLDTINKKFNTYKKLGATIYAWAYLNKKISLVGRFDYYEPNDLSFKKEDIIYYMLFGINYYAFQKKIIFSPNIIIEFYEQKINIENKKTKPSVTPRLTFYWSF